MKKYIAVLLTFVLLFSLIPAGTTAKAAELGDDPFYCISFSTPKEDIPYIYGIPYLWNQNITADTDWPITQCYGGNDEYEIAANIMEDFNTRPDGTRYFQLYMVMNAFRNIVEKVVYFDTAVELVKSWFTVFIEEYHRLGGKLDGVITDLEYIESQAYYIRDYYKGTRGKTENKNFYNEIVEDPRYETRIKPLLEEYGFKFFENVGGDKSEIFCIHSAEGEEGHGKCTAIWNYVMDRLEREAINEAVLEPLLKYYPDAVVTDYQSATLDTWYEAIDNHGEKISYNTVGAGNMSNMNTYVGRPQISFFGFNDPVYKNPPSYNQAVFEPTAFNVSNYDINLFKNMYASTDSGKIDMWFADYYYAMNTDGEIDAKGAGYGGTYCGTPYYSEVLYHIGLLDPEMFGGYLVTADMEKKGNTLEEMATVVSDIMAELTRVAGASDREPIMIPETAAYWNAGYILSGMYAAGRNIWRITPDTSVVSLEDFKVEGTDPTFYVDGMTVTFPQGKIVEDGEVYLAGSCGYWIETPKDVMPVVTVDADRFDKYPSFLEDFESYDAGMEFTSAAAQPATCWKVTGSASVQATGSGKALSVKGTATLENVKLPQNISAGDDYAMQQVWETTVTLPAGLNADASVTLFSCQENDGAIKISDGKVYYDEAGTYKQIEGVTLAADTAYTIKREIDFRDYDVFLSDYSVYDASGNLLGQVNDVSMAAFNLPVTSIKMTANHLNVPVLIDDYKLNPAGVSTVLELYDAQKGEKASDIYAPRTESTAYRMSWLNASAEKATAYVYNVETGDVVETIVMEPGADGVNIGIVEIAADKPVTLAVKTDVVEKPSTGNDTQGNDQTGNDQTGKDPGGDNQPGDAQHGSKIPVEMIVGVAAAVLAIGVAVVIVLVRKKKHTANTTEKTENE